MKKFFKGLLFKILIFAAIAGLFALVFFYPHVSVNILSSLISFTFGAVVVFILMSVGSYTFGKWLVKLGRWITRKGEKTKVKAKVKGY